MTIKNFFDKLFSKDKNGNVIDISSGAYASEEQLAVEFCSIFTVIETIAAMMSKAEIKLISDGEEKKSYEWYSLNVKPNRNQTASQFWHEFWCKLLYDKEVLVVNVGEQKLIADTFTISDDVVKEKKFTDVTIGNLTFNKIFKRSEVIYIKYTNQNIDAYMSSIYDTYAKLLSDASSKYNRTAGERGTLEISALATGDRNFENRYKEIMEKRFAPYFKAKNAVLPLYDGYKYVPTTAGTNSRTEESLDMQRAYNEALKRAAQVYKLNPALILGEVAGIDDAITMSMSSCFSPLAEMLKDELNAVEFSIDDLIDGKNYVVVDLNAIMYFDIYNHASNIDKLISCGYVSINEIRADTNRIRITEEWADKHFITKNYDDIDTISQVENNNAVGGENENET